LLDPSRMDRQRLKTDDSEHITGGSRVRRRHRHRSRDRRRLAADGFTVVVLGRRAEVLEEAAAALNDGLGDGRVTWRQIDLTDPGAVQALADELTATYGNVDALPLLRRPGGRIVLIGSMSSRVGGGAAAYGAAKASLNGWVVALTGGNTATMIDPGHGSTTTTTAAHRQQHMSGLTGLVSGSTLG